MSKSKKSAYNGGAPVRSVNRSCTDILCLLLFIVFIGGWIGIGVLGIISGDPDLLVYPSNSRGEICGRGSLSEKPYLLFHDPTKCLSLNSVFGCPTPQVCVEECPKQTTSLFAYATFLSTSGGNDFGNFSFDYQRQFCTDVNDTEWNNAVADQSGDLLLELISKNKCPSFTLESTPIIGRCLPDFGLIKNKVNETTIDDADGNHIANPDGDILVADIMEIFDFFIGLLNARGFAERVMSDLVSSKWMILAGEGIGVLVAFIWILMMRFMASVMVWASLIGTICLMALCAAYSWVKYDSFAVSTSSDGTGFNDINPLTDGFDAYLQIQDTWLAFFIISCIFLAIILLLTLFLRKRLMLAIALINESSKAVGSIFSSLFFPVFTFLLQLIVMAWFVVVAIFLASSGEQQFEFANKTDNIPCADEGKDCNPNQLPNSTDCECVFTQFGPNDLENYLQLYNLFGLFWGLCFVTAAGEMILAGAFSSWYWVMDKSDVPGFPILGSMGRTARYHMGTLAFGSLIIAIIKLIRAMIQYVQDKVKEYGGDNAFAKVILCMCKCCFWCLEKFMKFINRNAYILTSINGTNFCSSAKEAFNLILRNCVRVVVLDQVTGFLLFLGKLVVTATVTLLAFFYFSGGLNAKLALDAEEPSLNYYFVPVFVVMIGVYFTASCFFSVYSMALDTLFLCCLVDMEKNDGSREKPYFMSKSLRNILNLKQKKLK